MRGDMRHFLSASSVDIPLAAGYNRCKISHHQPQRKPMTVQIAYLADEQAGVPTGVRIVEPPPDTHQAQRGNFYALVDLHADTGGSGEAADILAERILSAMQRTYYTTKGTQSQVLTETMRSAQHILQGEIAQGREWRAGVLCVGLMSDRLALAGLGDAFAFVTTDGGGVNVYPADRLSPSFGVDGPLALWPLHRQKIEQGGALVAGGAEWLDQLSPRMLAGAAAFVTQDNCQDAADGLREQAGLTDIPGMLLVFSWDESAPTAGLAAPPPPEAAPPSSPPTSPPSPSSSPAAPSSSQPPSSLRSEGTGAAVRPARPGAALPTALNASPPVVDAPPAGSIAATGSAALAALPPAAAAPAPSSPAPSVIPAPAAFDAGETYTAASSTAPSSTGASPPSAGSSSSGLAMPVVLMASARAGFDRARGMFANILPDRGAPATPNPLAAGAGSGAAYDAQGSAAAAADRPSARPFTPPPAASGSRARLFIAIAVILLLLVPAIVAGMYWQQGASNRAEAESLLDLAEARLLSAVDALDQDDQTTARALLTEANEYVLQGEEILGRTARSGDLLDQIRSEQQAVMQIKPLYGLTAPLATFGADASPQRVLVIDQDVYVLDTGRNEVLQYRLDANGETLAGGGQVVLAEGDVVSGVTIGPLVDVAWQVPVPGYEDKASLLLLDANNRVFRYNQVDGSTLISFGEPSPWQQATQLEVFSDRLYVADEGANQIYRYAPGTYQDAPTPWFQPTTQVRLQGTEAMRIDGDIWLLFADGKVVRYHAGEQVPFSLDDSIALPADPVDLYVSQAVNDPSLYLADAAEERVLYFNKESGEFLGQFQAVEGRPLAGLRSIFIDEVRASLFLLTDEALYVQRLPR
jgi:hypothetical protein